MFDNRYEAVLADTETSRKINFKLRYRVFCVEKGYEDPAKFGHEMEHDPHDDSAVHFLVRDKERDRWIAAARLVIGTPDSLPVARAATVELPDLPPATVIAEFSRLLILDDYRSPTGKGMYEPEIVLGLFRAAREYSRQRRIDHWLLFCRRGLWRMLSNVGLDLRPAGPPCSFRGVRIPYRMDLQTAFAEVPKFSLRAHQMLSRPAKSFTHYSSYCLRGTGRSAAVLSRIPA